MIALLSLPATHKTLSIANISQNLKPHFKYLANSNQILLDFCLHVFWISILFNYNVTELNDSVYYDTKLIIYGFIFNKEQRFLAWFPHGLSALKRGAGLVEVDLVDLPHPNFTGIISNH